MFCTSRQRPYDLLTVSILVTTQTQLGFYSEGGRKKDDAKHKVTSFKKSAVPKLDNNVKYVVRLSIAPPGLVTLHMNRPRRSSFFIHLQLRWNLFQMLKMSYHLNLLI